MLFGVFLLIQYYSLNEFCIKNRLSCPNYGLLLSWGVLFLILGALLLTNGLFQPKINTKRSLNLQDFAESAYVRRLWM